MRVYRIESNHNAPAKDRRKKPCDHQRPPAKRDSLQQMASCTAHAVSHYPPMMRGLIRYSANRAKMLQGKFQEKSKLRPKPLPHKEKKYFEFAISA
jgi:hypothetical protein